MKIAWILNLSVLAMLCIERTETGCATTCTRSSKKVHKYTVRCGWWWKKRCTKHSSYFIDHETYTCYQPCPINGGWSHWSSWHSWNKCAPSSRNRCIGEQTRTRTRNCNSPYPQYGGSNCYGSGMEKHSRKCQLKDVLKNGGWSAWGNWNPISPCSRVCGKGVMIVIRQRSCNNPQPRCGGKLCEGTSLEYKEKDCYNQKHCGSKVLAKLKKASTKKLKSKKN